MSRVASATARSGGETASSSVVRRERVGSERLQDWCDRTERWSEVTGPLFGDVKRLQSSVDIDAPAAVVWNVLTDFEAYPEWNPLITRIEGVPERGERLRVRVEPPGGRSATFRPRVLSARENETFEWYGKLFVQGLFDGRHGFDIEELDDGGVRFTQRETFSGLLVGIALQEAPLLAGFDAMNDALKDRAEAAAGSA